MFKEKLAAYGIKSQHIAWMNGAAIYKVGFAIVALSAYAVYVSTESNHEYSFSGLGDLPGGDFSSSAKVISTDGRVIAGIGVGDSKGIVKSLVIWQDGEIQDLGVLHGKVEVTVNGISDNGSVIVGDSGNQAFVWRKEKGIQSLGKGDANGVSPDGKLVIGSARHRATIWRVDDFNVFKQIAPKGRLHSSGICVGNAANTACLVSTQKGFLWSGNETVKIVDDGLILNMSDKQEYAVGFAANNEKERRPTEGFLWSRKKGLTFIPGLKEGASTTATAVSENGKVVVGYTSRIKKNGIQTWTMPFIWTEESGKTQSLEAYIKARGVSLEGWTLHGASDISGDGKTIIGTGQNPEGNTEAWIIQLK